MKIVRLTQEHSFKSFDCGESDLNDFLLQDAKQYLKGLLAVTYVIEDDDSTVAFFSLSNDRISRRYSSNVLRFDTVDIAGFPFV